MITLTPLPDEWLTKQLKRIRREVMTKKPSYEEDWLKAQYSGSQAQDACIFALFTVVGIASSCCNPPLSLQETKDLLETVWYENITDN